MTGRDVEGRGRVGAPHGGQGGQGEGRGRQVTGPSLMHSDGCPVGTSAAAMPASGTLALDACAEDGGPPPAAGGPHTDCLATGGHCRHHSEECDNKVDNGMRKCDAASAACAETDQSCGAKRGHDASSSNPALAQGGEVRACIPW